jgi:hypothetical protein
MPAPRRGGCVEAAAALKAAMSGSQSKAAGFAGGWLLLRSLETLALECSARGGDAHYARGDPG